MARRSSAALLAIMASSACAVEDAAPQVFNGYDAFYATLGARLFTEAQGRTIVPRGLGQPAGDLWRWTLNGRPHVLEIRGADVIIDGRWLSAAKAKRFEGEPGAPELGRSATVYANEQAVCVEGVPPSASGTMARHVRVSLIVPAYGAHARRYELPSLFASCLALTQEVDGIGFFQARYRWPEGAPEALGLTLERWRLIGGRFVPLGSSQTTTFVESGNVYRFTSP